MLDYYLHPAGLLVEPAEGRIQFAHLSFQEYLCAEYLYGQALAKGSRRFLDETRRLLLDELHQPGWDEVGMLFLTIHALQGAQTQGSAHQEVLAELDLAHSAEARLLVAALTGRELDYSPAERRRWLPLALAAALLHPNAGLAWRFKEVPKWEESGLTLERALLRAEDPWIELRARLLADPPSVCSSAGEWEESDLVRTKADRWRNPTGNSTWDVDEQFGAEDARASALLLTLLGAGWGLTSEASPTAPPPPQDTDLADWLVRRAPPLYLRGEDNLPEPNNTALALDTLLPSRGHLWWEALRQIPLDLWMLQGEAVDDEDFFSFSFSQPVVLLAIYPQETLPAEARLALAAYQWLLLVESLAAGQGFDQFSWSWSWSRSLSLSLSLRDLLTKMEKYVEKLPEAAYEQFSLALERFGYRYAALDWFAEQADHPELMLARGLRPGQPIPPEFDLFDAQGHPRPQWPRTALVRARAWLEVDENLLNWTFPEGLPEGERQDLLGQLALLRSQPWSPQAALDALLSDWPENEPEWGTTLADAEVPLLRVCEQILAELGNDDVA
ncbi:hypothetical protein CCP3SC1_940006 [Gammaproteobacteria bacterium]